MFGDSATPKLIDVSIRKQLLFGIPRAPTPRCLIQTAILAMWVVTEPIVQLRLANDRNNPESFTALFADWLY